MHRQATKNYLAREKTTAKIFLSCIHQRIHSWKIGTQVAFPDFNRWITNPGLVIQQHSPNNNNFIVRILRDIEVQSFGNTEHQRCNLTDFSYKNCWPILLI